MSTVKINVHFLDSWKDVCSGVSEVEYSTETIHAEDKWQAESQLEKLKETVGTSVSAGTEHTRKIIGIDEIAQVQVFLTNEQMMKFILDNNVELALDGSVWQKTDGTKVRVKYRVTINGTAMCGMDLEDAINYYVNNIRGKKC